MKTDKKIEEKIKEILLKHDIQNRLDVELLAELTNLLTQQREEAVREFIKEATKVLRETDIDIGQVEDEEVVQEGFTLSMAINEIVPDMLEEFAKEYFKEELEN